MSRIETGAVQFGDDWPATVIRGDNVMWYNMQLNLLLEKVEQTDWAEDYASVIGNLRGLQKTLASCAAGPIDNKKADCQFLKPFEECVKPQETKDDSN